MGIYFFLTILEIEDYNKKYKILSDNLHMILFKELQKLSNCVNDFKEQIGHKNFKLMTFVENLEKSIQQYELVQHEIESAQRLIKENIFLVNQTMANETLKMYNPASIVLDMMKNFHLIMHYDAKKKINSKDVSWLMVQKDLKNFQTLKTRLECYLINSLPQEIIHDAVFFHKNYIEAKKEFNKINKNLVIFLDILKNLVEYNIKKDINDNLYRDNKLKHKKILLMKTKLEDRNSLVNDATNCQKTLKIELDSLKVENSNQVI